MSDYLMPGDQLHVEHSFYAAHPGDPRSNRTMYILFNLNKTEASGKFKDIVGL
jgi:hypothetical protein